MCSFPLFPSVVLSQAELEKALEAQKIRRFTGFLRTAVSERR